MTSTTGATIAIEVACALPERQLVVALEVLPGTTALEAVALADIAAAFPEVEIDPARIGVHGRLLGTRGLAPAALYAVRAGDRVEVYRPLRIDPKAARRRAAAAQLRSRSAAGAGSGSSPAGTAAPEGR